MSSETLFSVHRQMLDCLLVEAQSIKSCAERLDPLQTEKAVNLLLRCVGKVVVLGVGKSGIIAHKVAATLSSTGTPAIHLHASDALQEVGETYKIPTLTDIHETHHAALAARYVDVLQIPAFLCRQTELLVAAAETGKAVNVKKGQFMSGTGMQFAVEKIQACGNENVILTDRGNSFGYSDLVVDFRNIPEMKAFGVPVVMDCTHSLQQPNQASGVTGGRPALIATIAKAAIATGADGLFIETHPRPLEAKSDAANMLPLDQLGGLLQQLVRVRRAVQEA